MRWYAVLFWIWVIGSLMALVWRRTQAPARSGGIDDAPDRVRAPERVWAPPPLDSHPDEPSDPARLDGLDRPQEGSAPAMAAVADPAPSERATTLPELLAGITLPHGLVPLTQSGVADIATHIVVATSSAPADVVGAGLVDELERLGYRVSPTGPTTSVAEGPRGEVGVEVHANATSVTGDSGPRFPTASPGMVVVELRALSR